MSLNIFSIPQVYAESLGTPIIGTGKFQTAVTASGPSKELGTFISSIITSITVFAGLAFVLYFTIGAMKWIIAGGDKTKVSESKEQMTQATIGLIAVVVSFFIIGIVGSVLGLDVLNPFKTLFSSTSSGITGPSSVGGGAAGGRPLRPDYNPR